MTAPRAGSMPAIGGWLGWLLLIAGVVGLAASGTLMIEKIRLLENPFYVPACSLGEAVNCAAVMRSPQSVTFGLPNPVIGLAGFGGLAATGLLLVTGGRLSRGYWWVLQVGVTLAVIFVHWLIFQAVYRIGALCPFCMAVWAVTIPAFWYVTLHNTRQLAGRNKLVAVLHRNHGIVITAWLLLVAVLVAERFWAPWPSVFG